MKLRLDEYYWCASEYWDYIDEYMPKELADKMREIEKSDNSAYDATNKFLEKTYSHLEVVEKELVDVIDGCPEYRVIIKLNNKYYSFFYFEDDVNSFDESFDMEQDLIEVTPTKVTVTKYI